MQLSLKILFFFFSLMSVFFVVLGLYSLDAVLLSVSMLFAVATVLVAMEAKQYQLNPFRNS